MKNLKVKEVKYKPIKMQARSSAEIGINIYVKEEPICFKIIPSGWSMPRQFHVIIELGAYDDSTYKGTMTEEQIKKEYGIDLPDYFNLDAIATKIPNDQEFGKEVRKLVNEINQKTEI